MQACSVLDSGSASSPPRASTLLCWFARGRNTRDRRTQRSGRDRTTAGLHTAENEEEQKRSRAGSTRRWESKQHGCWMSTEGAGHSRPFGSANPTHARLPNRRAANTATNEQRPTNSRTEKGADKQATKTDPKLHESNSKFAQVKFSLARAYPQDIIA